MIRVITIGREYGSGGGSIAAILARKLGWRLIDDSLIARISEAARTSPAEVKCHDETVDPWFYRLTSVLWRGGFEVVMAPPDAQPVDADAIAALWHRVIVEAAAQGGCVTVGRGGQCLLKRRPDVFHVYVYAPLGERVARLEAREPPGTGLRAAAIDRDRRRRAYIRHYFNEDWTNPHLYHLMLCSSFGLELAANLILSAAGLKSGS